MSDNKTRKNFKSFFTIRKIAISIAISTIFTDIALILIPLVFLEMNELKTYILFFFLLWTAMQLTIYSLMAIESLKDLDND